MLSIISGSVAALTVRPVIVIVLPPKVPVTEVVPAVNGSGDQTTELVTLPVVESLYVAVIVNPVESKDSPAVYVVLVGEVEPLERELTTFVTVTVQVFEYCVPLIVAFAVIVAVPAATPVTVMFAPLADEDELMLATELFDVVHVIVPLFEAVADNVVVLPTEMLADELLIVTPSLFTGVFEP